MCACVCLCVCKKVLKGGRCILTHQLMSSLQNKRGPGPQCHHFHCVWHTVRGPAAAGLNAAVKMNFKKWTGQQSIMQQKNCTKIRDILLIMYINLYVKTRAVESNKLVVLINLIKNLF